MTAKWSSRLQIFQVGIANGRNRLKDNSAQLRKKLVCCSIKFTHSWGDLSSEFTWICPFLYLSICLSAQLCSVCGKQSSIRNNEDIAHIFGKEFKNIPNGSKDARTMLQQVRRPLLSVSTKMEKVPPYPPNVIKCENLFF